MTIMKTRIAAAVAAVVLGVAAPVSTVMASPYKGSHHRVAPATTYDGLNLHQPSQHGHLGSRSYGCASSASEGNAMQQTRPVMQYGQTAGGTRC